MSNVWRDCRGGKLFHVVLVNLMRLKREEMQFDRWRIRFFAMQSQPGCTDVRRSICVPCEGADLEEGHNLF